jgi:hypothetical protein
MLLIKHKYLLFLNLTYFEFASRPPSSKMADTTGILNFANLT